MEKEVNEYLRGERQWFRTQRIDRAKYLKGRDGTDRSAFWDAVISRLETQDD